MKFDFLQKMSYRELMNLDVKVKKAIADQKIAAKSSLKKQVEELIQKSGFERGEIVGGTQAKSLKGRKIPIKYQNPKNPEHVWTGRGRQPKWLAAELERGRSLESFLITK